MTFVIISAGLINGFSTSEPMTGDELIANAEGISPEMREWLGDPRGSTLLRINDALIVVRVVDPVEAEKNEWRLQIAEAKHAVSTGQACLDERARGKGPCGACPVCCAELRAERDALLWRLKKLEP